MKLNMTTTTRTWVDTIGGDQDGQTKIRLMMRDLKAGTRENASLCGCLSTVLSSHLLKVWGSELWTKQPKKPISLHDHSICVDVALALASITNRTCRSVVTLKMSKSSRAMHVCLLCSQRSWRIGTKHLNRIMAS